MSLWMRASDEERLNKLLCIMLNEIAEFARTVARKYGVEIELKLWNAQCPNNCNIPGVSCDDNDVPTVYARP